MASENLPPVGGSGKCFCVVAGCGRPKAARGLCKTHWQRWRKHGDPTIGALSRLPAQCEIDGCGRKPHTRRDGVAVCNLHWQRLNKHGATETPARPASPHAICCIDECGRLARTCGGRQAYLLCEMHYMRLHRAKRVGREIGPRLERKRPKERYMHSGGYVVIRAEGHPLPARRGDVVEYEHRIVFYDAHGEGPFECHHCGVTVTWSDMHVDHLNDTRDDNDPDNLVASCPACNQKRGHHKIAATKRRQGRQLTAFGRTMCLSEWAREIGISQQSLRLRIDRGWTIDRALSEPRGRFGPR